MTVDVLEDASIIASMDGFLPFADVIAIGYAAYNIYDIWDWQLSADNLDILSADNLDILSADNLMIPKEAQTLPSFVKYFEI